MLFEDKRILVTGGTGSLGKVLVRRLLSGELGHPAAIVVFSRDEAKQHEMRLSYLNRKAATDDAIYRNYQELLSFHIGDVRDYSAICHVLRDVDIVFHAAALKQVPTCEYFPVEAVRTNILGAYNVVRAIRENNASVELVIGISTDKACKPINVMGMTKAVQERIFIEANLGYPKTRFVCVRYGNVLASRGSVVPLFLDQIEKGGPVTITTPEMTRFLLTLDQAVDTIFAAAAHALPGELYVPKVPSARIVSLAEVLIGRQQIPIDYIGIRPGEKVHEILVAEEESYRTIERDGYYVISPMLPELKAFNVRERILQGEYSSANATLGADALRKLLVTYMESSDE